MTAGPVMPRLIVLEPLRGAAANLLDLLFPLSCAVPYMRSEGWVWCGWGGVLYGQRPAAVDLAPMSVFSGPPFKLRPGRGRSSDTLQSVAIQAQHGSMLHCALYVVHCVHSGGWYMLCFVDSVDAGSISRWGQWLGIMPSQGPPLYHLSSWGWWWLWWLLWWWWWCCDKHQQSLLHDDETPTVHKNGENVPILEGKPAWHIRSRISPENFANSRKISPRTRGRCKFPPKHPFRPGQPRRRG